MRTNLYKSLLISPADVTDIDAMADIHVAGFSPYASTLLVNPSARGQYEDIRRELHEQMANSDMMLVKATLGSEPRPVAWAAWHRVDRRRSTSNGSALQSDTAGAHVYVNGLESSNRAALAASTCPASLGRKSGPEPLSTFWAAINQSHAKMRSSFFARPARPYLILATLVTSPEHQGHGIGGTLMKWGLDLADREGLPTWVDAETLNVGYYESAGFGGVGSIVLDLSRWATGGRGGNMGFGSWELWAGLRLPVMSI